MKNVLIILVLFVLVSISITAQSIYFDVGLGFGNATSEIDGVNVSDAMGVGVTEVGVDLSLKIGGGPVADFPLYFVAAFEGIGHRFEDSLNYIQLNSYLIGPGVVFYPIPFIQLGGSIGYSFISNQTDLPLSFYDSESGYAYNLYVAMDIGKKNNGFLIGAKYFMARNTIEVSNVEQKSSLISVFFKYAYRVKD